MSTALKQPIRTAKDATSFPADSGIEAQLPPSPPLSASQVIDPSQEPSRESSESVSKLLRTFRSLKAGIRTGQPPWDKHRLLREEYKELWERLDEDEDLRAWIDDKLSYIRGSESNIGTVIGLNIEYTPPGKPSKTKLATIFRSEDGNPTQGSLALTLDDFLPSSIKKTISASSDRLLPVSITFEDLISDLIKSEKAMALLHTRTGLSATPPKKWLKRPGTPVEELDTQRERKYQALEETKERKVSQEDSDYSPPAPGTPEPVEAVRPTAVPRRSTRQRRVLEEG
ncbi:hypothetical protein B0A49_10135 [Cryomyces minteri]|uniref:Uncharacterized protein n=1 Tax=Cryomyces minteri TaxID=331657 RepID=A0A4U0WNJ3_9PEZI|nr:hypothetical protein B0A49_10135 [Cryomyces minteri]